MQDPYCYPNSRTLKNKFDIRDYDELLEAERRLTKYRTRELFENPIIGSFDLLHLQKIHAYLFQDLYDWAGEIRTVDIAKGDLFCRVFTIESEANRIFTELKNEKYLKNLSVTDFGKRLAYYFGEINALHPFREGNGRTQREFIRQLAFQNNYYLSYFGITSEEMIAASKDALKLNHKKMEELILSHLRTFL